MIDSAVRDGRCPAIRRESADVEETLVAFLNLLRCAAVESVTHNEAVDGRATAATTATAAGRADTDVGGSGWKDER
jgi:hypothetical protein